MGFHALFERENVLDILQGTLQDYYQQKFPDQEISVGFEKREDAVEFYLIPRIGMIIQKKPGREIRKNFYDAYHIRNNLIKFLGAKTLVFLGLHTPKLLAMKQRLYVWPKELVNEKTFFSYCNRSVRIFDYDSCTTVSIKKQGFTDKFFRNQLQFRLDRPYQFIPEVLEHGTDWFRENIQTGRVLARVTDAQQYEAAQTQVMSCIEQLQTDTLQTDSTQIYVESLGVRLEDMLRKTAQTKTTKYYEYAMKYQQKLRQYLQTAPASLDLVISHKDLQGGNILVTPKKLWIIDWETQGWGSRWFDAITRLYGTRYYGGIHKLTQKVLKNDLSDRIGPTQGWNARQILAIFLLEDMEFYLEDMLELPGIAGAATFERYMTEIQETDWTMVF